MVALRRLSDAERDGDKIYALIRGIGSSSDGMAKSIFAPLSGGQALAIQRAYENAEFSPTEIELVEAHGTATKANDEAEFNGLNSVFGNKENTGNPFTRCVIEELLVKIERVGEAVGEVGENVLVVLVHVDDQHVVGLE